ncbi:hypothetical protein Lalb_Chr01g0005521 [Lupinus albus]|uniref:Uncharacterized protein n=1 Tax=Lupinus albus TaxID=3870 RepID=A0A6A4R3K5_LUPAL|nr:hypothetical protein Lalb_Chr01g0005521 [Lupinus albus]
MINFKRGFVSHMNCIYQIIKGKVVFGKQLQPINVECYCYCSFAPYPFSGVFNF